MAEVINARWIVRKLYRDSKSDYYYGNLRDDRSGAVHRFSTGETNARRAKQRVLDHIRELETREAGDALPAARFDHCFESWLSLKTCRPITLAAYRFDFQGVYRPEFGERLLGEIAREDVKQFLKRLHDEGASARTRSKHLGTLRGFFREMVLDRKCGSNPCEGLKVGRGEKRENMAITFDQARALLAAARQDVVMTVEDARRGKWRQSFRPPPHLFVAIALACYTGLRRANITGLRWRHVDLGQRKISIPGKEMKGKRDHEVPIHPVLLRVLESLLKGKRKADPEARVLGAKLATITKSYQAACRRAGLPAIGWHTLRHSWASWLAPRCSFPCLKTLMAHSPGNQVTLTYAHPSWEELVAAVETLPDLLTPEASALAAAAGN